MTPRLIVFDFDGTIADTPQTVFAIVNRLAEEFNYPALSAAQILTLQGLSSREIVRQADVSMLKLPFLLRRVKQELNREISSIQPISGMEAALQELKAQGYRLGILTSNRQDSVTTFLATNNLQNIFEFIDSDVTLFGKHRKIRRLLRLNRLNPQEFVYVGDETRDIEAAQKSKVWAIAVGWGFNAPALLARYNPDNLVTTPPALVAAIAQLTHLEN
ncbi:MAG: HAD-IA family hydrolase [Jaaginema sp. PMC 1080.18]|nr:HAD-IA family hydrolase [Jaaginema sp. PMC 1080.18]MEC4868720.1 HAD-IA family hydrolase [Jaaginema sp. PMC 1078.18]